MNTTQIFIAGFGGQGILFAGKLLAYTCLELGCQLSWLPSYGPEMRGGTANCSVILSDDPIGSPIISKPDILMVMNLPSLEKYEDSPVPGGKIFVDSTQIDKKVERTDVDTYYVPSTKIATDMGAPNLANMVLLGKLLKESGVVPFDTVVEVLKKIIPPKRANLLEINVKAISAGYNYEA